MRLFTFLFFLCIAVTKPSSAQLLQDDFSDTDLSTNPTWSSSNTVNASFGFQVSGGQLITDLPSGGSGTRRSWISSPLTIADLNTTRTIWRFKAKVDFIPPVSGVNTNYARIYLTSNNSDLNGSLQGYFLIIRDNVSLHRQDGSDSGANTTEIISGTTTGLLQNLNDIVVIRNSDSEWSLFVDSNLEGQVNDNTFTSSDFFGAQVRYSAASRRDDFYFDDFLVEETPSLQSVTVNSNTSVTLNFREDLTGASAGNTANYSLSPANTLLSAVQNVANLNEVTLTFQNPFADNVEQTLSLSNLAYITSEVLNSSFPLITKFTYTTPDITAPTINSISANTINSILVKFDEDIAPASINTLSQYSLDNGVGNPTTASIGTNADELILSFSSNLVFGQNYTLTLSGIEDLSGNSITPSINFPFIFQDILPPNLDKVEVIAPNSLLLFFDEALQSTIAETLTNYQELDNNSNPIAASFNSANNTVLLVFNGNFDENQTITLAIQNLQDLQGNTLLGTLNKDFEYDTRNPRVETDGVVATSATQITVTFSEEIEIVSAQTLNHYEITPTIGFPTQAVLNPSNPREVTLSLATPLTPNIEYNLRATNIADLAGNRFTSNNRKFIYDLIPPQITLVEVLGNNSILVEFSEPLKESTATVVGNYSISGIGNPSSVQFLESAPQRVLLQFGSALPTNSLTLTINNVEDLGGNLLAINTVNIDNTVARITKIEVLSPTLLEVYFSRNVDETTAETIGNYSGVGTIVSATLNNTDKWKVRLELKNTLNFGQSYTLSIKNIEDENNNLIPTQSELFTVTSRIVSATLTTLQQVEVLFDTPVNASSASDITQYKISPAILPIAANQDSDNESLVRLFFSPDLAGNQNLSLKIGNIELQDGSISAEETKIIRLDTQAPNLVSAIILDSQRVQLTFNEAIEETTAEALNHYQLNGSNPTDIEFDTSNPSEIILTFGTQFDFGSSYTLSIQNLKDLAVNEINAINTTISRATPPEKGNLIITEIMANPNDSTTLPNSEYIEIYNTSSQAQALQGVVFKDATGEATLGAYTLNSGEYLIICDEDDVSLFQAYGAVLGLENWRSLSNTGELLSLISPNGETIFSVDYKDDWFIDESKASGGWSLEMIRTDNLACQNFEENWAGSINANGGTPGTNNSRNGVYPNIQPLKIENWELTTENRLSLSFNQTMDSLSLLSLGNYQLSNNTINSISLNARNEILLTVSNEWQEGIIYELQLINLFSCTGSAIDTTVQIIRGKTPQQGEIIFNEIMADPTPPVGLPEVEYIELNNTTNQYLQLENLVLSDATSSTQLPNILIGPNGFIVLSSNLAAQQLTEFNAIGISGFPSLNNTGELLSLKDSTGNIIDEVNYSDDWYGDANKSEGGWSLERISSSCSDTFWVASSNEKGGTPNAENSTYLDNTLPILTNWQLINSSVIQIEFSEQINLTTQNIDFTISIDSIITTEKTSFNIYLQNELSEGVLNEFKLTTTDCFNNLLDTSFQIVRGKVPEKKDIIFNEIMTDPSPSVRLPEVEYIELKNTTNQYLQLEKLVLSDATSSTQLPNILVEPKGFILLSSTSAAQQLSEFNTIGVSGFPSLNNTGELLTLKDSIGNIIDEVNYSDEWYRDENKSEGGWSLERVSSNCDEDFWVASQDEKGGTPNTQNSVITDSDAPELNRWQLLSSSGIQFNFSEQVNLTSQNIDFAISIDSIVNTQNNSWNIYLQNDLIQGNLYEIKLFPADCFGNLLDTTVQVVRGKVPATGEIVFNEIMADPTPPVGLPEVEYIELNNTTNQYLQLENLVLSDATSSTQLPNILVEPNSFVLLSSTSAALELTEFNAIGISGFPSLNNSGEFLSLKNSIGNIIDEVNYSDDWYRDSNKANGGWSLERIASSCSDAFWVASQDEKGGTPNAENSTYIDNQAPTLDSWTFISNSTIQFNFSEQVNLHVQNIHFNTNIDSISNTQNYSWNLYLENELIEGQLYDFLLSTTDCYGNLLDTTVQVVRGKTPIEGEIIFNEIMADPSPSVGLPEVEYIELKNKTNQYLQLEKLILSDATSSTPLPNILVEPIGFILLSSTSAAQQLTKFNAIGISGFPSLNNSGELLSLKDSLGTIIDEVNYSDDWYRDEDKSEGGWSLEHIASNCNDDFWNASSDIKGGTPNAENATYTDNNPPTLTNWQLIAPSVIQFEFSEQINLSKQSLQFNISIDSIMNTENTSWNIYLQNELQEGILNEFKLTTTDCFNNLLDTIFQIVRGKVPIKGDIIFNEIMVDPSPSVGLPEVEFIELKNTTKQFLQLENLVLSDATSSTQLPNILVEPKGFALLSSTSAAQELMEFNAIGVSGFPSLNNSGELLSLKDSIDNIIDEVNYSDEWYRDESKSKGGWSLERIASNCKGVFWIASSDIKGGTPNAENATYIDNQNPTLENWTFISNSVIQFNFSEQVNLSIQHVGFEIPVDSIIAKENNSWNLYLENELTKGQLYDFQLSITDCFGNSLDTTFQIVRGKKPIKGEIVFNEMMADPSPSIGLPKVEYIELKNTTNQYLQLEGYELKDITSTSTLPLIIIKPNEMVLLTSTSGAIDLANYNPIGVSNFISLNNTGETLSLLDANENIIDEITFSDDWYGDTEKSNGGWSLERIDANFSCNAESNWSASIDSKGGTPNAPNSIEGIFNDVTAPSITEVIVTAKDAIKIKFSEEVDSLSTIFGTYVFNQSISVSKIIFGNKSEITIQLSDSLDFTSRYSLEVSNIQDCAGNTLSQSDIIYFSRPKTATINDILISEILFNPPPNGVDFVEIYNNSDFYIDLKDWKLADGRNNEINNLKIISNKNQLFPPKSFLVLTPDKNILQSFYPQIPDSVLIEMNFPTYPDDDGVVVLLNNNDEIMDLFSYDEDFHFQFLDDEEGVSLERVSYDVSASIPDNWKSAASTEGYATPGKRNSQSSTINSPVNINDCFSISPEVFTPDGDGIDDFASIRFNCSLNNQVINIIIYDVSGREIKRLVRNQTLGNQSFFTWDGADENGRKVRTGSYLLWIETFNLNGNVNRVRKRIVVGSRF